MRSRQIQHAAVAHPVERHHGKVEVMGSSPIGGSILFLETGRLIFHLNEDEYEYP